MPDKEYYPLTMSGEEANTGIEVGMALGKLNGIPQSNGNNELSMAVPGVDYGYPLLQGNGPPTADTAASFGQHYYDLSATKPPFEQICIAFSETGGFVWRQHNDAGYFLATYGLTTFQEISNAYNLGKVCIALDNGNIYYIGQISSTLCVFNRAGRATTITEDGFSYSAIEWANVQVTSGNTWSRTTYNGENIDNRTLTVNEQSTDAQYPTAKAVYTYGQSIDTAAKGYTDEQLEPVEEAAGKAEEYALGAYVTPTASGSIATFDDGADGLPVKSLVVGIEPVQAGSGEPSPENVRPITGHTGATLTRAGKNLLENTVDAVTSHGITFTKGSDGVISYTGTSDGMYPYYSGMGAMSYANTIRLPAGEYVASSGNANVRTLARKVYADESYELIGATPTVNFTLAEATNIWITFHLAPVTSGTAYSGIFYPQLEVGSTATAYEPYRGETYDISFPGEAGAIYGAKLNVTTGTLTVDKVKHVITADEVEPGWANANYTQIAYAQIPWPEGSTLQATGGKNAYFLSEEYILIRTENFDSSDNVGKAISNADGLKLWFGFPHGTSLEDMRSALDGKFFLYELVTPLIYQLSPIEVQTLLGVNNIFTDAGSAEVSYRADPTLIYNKIIAAIISSGGTV